MTKFERSPKGERERGNMFIKKIGIDLGTCNSLVFIPEKGVILNEPSVVAVSVSDNKILAIGKEAKEMIGRTPEAIIVFKPLKDGVIADYRITEAMLRYFIKKSGGSLKILKPEVVIAVPSGITTTEKRAVIETGMNAGARAVYVVKEPILGAIGAGIPINSCSGHLVIDIGGGTTEVAVISLGGIVGWASEKIGGDKIDLEISNFIKKKYNLIIGEQTAEEIKIKIGSASPLEKNESIEIKGRDLINGLPKTIKISNSEISETISPVIIEIIKEIKAVLKNTPPELSADIIERGMILFGGGALLRNIDEVLTQAIGIPCFVAEDPLFCVIRGTEAILENLDTYKKSLLSKK